MTSTADLQHAPIDPHSPCSRALAWVLSVALFVNPLGAATAQQIVVATGSTTVGKAANGVPVVNIAAPNARGLSHNRFTDYNVGSKGLVLNNATDAVHNTQLAGYIVGNRNLNGQAASLILNEVTGGRPSLLAGYTEIAGQAARLVVANPWGLTCNGCGFINSPRVTLTTGTPRIEDGRLAAFRVEGGEIVIEGAGLNASNIDQFDLVTRSARINAELYARRLNIVTGRNEVAANSLAATALAADGSAPLLAIDSAALGGMYANSIMLVGAEAGVGVRLAGDLAASAGDIRIDAAGHLSLARSAASGAITAAAKSIDLTGTTYAGGKLDVAALDGLTISADLASGGDLALSAQRIDNAATIEAGVLTDGVTNAGARLQLSAGALANSGRVVSHGALAIEADLVDNRGGALSGWAGLALTGGRLDNQGGALQSQGDLLLAIDDDLVNTGGSLVSGSGDVDVRAGNLDNRQGTLSAIDGQVSALLSGWLNNGEPGQGGLIQGAGLALATGGALTNGDGRIQALGGDADLSAAAFDNQHGTFYARDTLRFAGGALDNRNGQLAASYIDLRLSALLDNRQGVIEASGSLAVTGTAIDNQGGQLRALGDGGETRLALDGLLDNRSGVLEASNHDLRLSMGSLANQGGSLLHAGGGELGIASAQLVEAGGQIVTQGGLTVDAASWHNSGTLQARQLTLNVGSFAQTADGQLLATESLTGTGTSWTNDGLIASDDVLSLMLTGGYAGNGRLTSLGDLGLTAANLDLGSSGTIAAGGQAAFVFGGQADNRGRITAAGDLQLSATTLNNRGTLGSAQHLTLDTGTLLNENGLIFSGGDMALQVNDFTNRHADVYSLGTLSIAGAGGAGSAGTVVNRSGAIESAGNMTILAGALENRPDVFEIDRQLISGYIAVRCYDCKNDHYTVDYYVRENFQTEVQADAPSSIASGGNFNFFGTTFSNQLSAISAAGDISIEAAVFNNEGAVAGTLQRTRIYNQTDVTDGTVKRLAADHILPYNQRNNPDFPYVYYVTTSGKMRLARVDLVRLENESEEGGSPGSYLIYTDAQTGQNLGSLLTGYVNFSLFGGYELPESLYNPNKLVGLPSPFKSMSLRSDLEVFTATGSNSNAVIQAGGKVSITAGQTLGNGAIRHDSAPAQGGQPSVDTAPAQSVTTTVIELNPQLPPDLAQQQVNPLTLPGFSLPVGENGLFRLSDGMVDAGGVPLGHATQPHKYLIETNPALTELTHFLNSDYLLGALGYDPDAAQRRLGDGLYEQRLVREAVLARTGQRYLAGLTSDEAMYRYLMDNALASKAALSLSVGVSLTAEQVAALTHDIVWLESHEVNGQEVLVPVLYLAQAEGRLAPNGALVQGRELTLIAGGALANRGTLRADEDLTAAAGLVLNGGLMQAGERLSVWAEDSIANTRGGILVGRDVALTAAGGDLINERTISRFEGTASGFTFTHSFADAGARIEAQGNLSLSAGRDLYNLGSTLAAGGELAMAAGGNLVIGAAEARDESFGSRKRSQFSTLKTTQYGADVSAGGSFSAVAGGDLAVIGSRIEAGGDATLAAGRDLTLAAVANVSHTEYHYKSHRKKLDLVDTTVRQKAAELDAGGTLTLAAGQDLTMVASAAHAGEEAYLYAGRDLALLAAENRDYYLYDKKKKGSWGSKKTQRDEVTTITQIGSTVTADGDVTLTSGADQRYQLASLKSGADLTLDAGGDIVFEAVKDLAQESHEKSSSSWAWNSAKGKGHTDETVRLSTLTAGGELAIQAAGKIRIDIPEVSQQTVSQTISALVEADPQLAWLQEMDERGDIDWQRVKEVHDSFKYSHSGMGQVLGIVVAIVVTVATWGAGSAISATVGNAYGAAAGAAAQAAFHSMASTVVVSAINNKGDPGKTLKAAFSEDALKSYVTAAATAALTTGLIDDYFSDKANAGGSGANSTTVNVSTGTSTTSGAQVATGTGPSFNLNSWSGVGQFAAYQGTRAVVSSAVDTAINGGSFEDKLATALTSAAIHTVSAASFNQVGNLGLDNGSIEKVAVKALVGGLISQAATGDFATGALAAGANEALVEHLAALVDHDPQLLGMASQLVGAVSAGVSGGDASLGANLALYDTQYNRQLHPSEAKLIKDNAARYARERDISPEQAEAELTQQALRNVDTAHERRLGEQDPQAQAFLQQLGAGELRTDGLSGESYQLFAASAEVRENHAMFGQYAKDSPAVKAALDRAYAQAFKPASGQTIEGVNGTQAGALAGSDLALNDAARDYRHMREQPAAVQWAVLGQLRQERQENLESQLALSEELLAMNAAGTKGAVAAQRRSDILLALNRLELEDNTLRQASVVQLQAMGSAGVTSPVQHPEWAEGAGAIALGRLTLGGMSAASISSRIGVLRGAVEEAKAGAKGGLPPLRNAYINEVKALEDVALNMRAAGASPEQVARQLHQMRRDLGVQYKELTPVPQLEAIYARNLEKYGDKLGPTVDWLRANGKSWQQIIESASRSGGKDLGF